MPCYFDLAPTEHVSRAQPAVQRVSQCCIQAIAELLTSRQSPSALEMSSRGAVVGEAEKAVLASRARKAFASAGCLVEALDMPVLGVSEGL